MGSGVKRDVPCVLLIRRMWPTFERNFAMLGCQCSTPPPTSSQCTLATPFSHRLSRTTSFATVDTTYRQSTTRLWLVEKRSWGLLQLLITPSQWWTSLCWTWPGNGKHLASLLTQELEDVSLYPVPTAGNQQSLHGWQPGSAPLLKPAESALLTKSPLPQPSKPPSSFAGANKVVAQRRRRLKIFAARPDFFELSDVVCIKVCGDDGLKRICKDWFWWIQNCWILESQPE